MKHQMIVIGISRHRIKIDGEGVTTLVCSKYCLLKCKYCINENKMKFTDKYTIMSVDELYERVKIDNLYFLTTGGGITFGGGEPLLDYKFIHDFCKKYKFQTGWKINIETSLNVPNEYLKMVEPFIDEFIIDIKDMNPNIYNKYTRLGNDYVISNLQYLIDLGRSEKMLIRVPLIPGYNEPEDQNSSIEKLKQLGLNRFNIFTYQI